MKLRQIFYFVAGLLSIGALAQAQPTATNVPIAGTPAAVPPTAVSPTNAASTNAESLEAPGKAEFSHALGIYYSQGVTNNMVNAMGLDLKTDVDLGLFMEAFSNVVAGSTMTINIDDLRKVLRQHDTYHTNQLRIETNKLIAEGPETKIKGEKFMDDMAKAPDIKKLASGVLYKVIKDGDGIMATPVDVATMTFHVSRIDGKEVWKIEHAPARVSDPLLPPGIREVVPMMKAGSHWMVYLPYTAAYGDKPGIPNAREGFMFAPYSAVVFDLEVEKVDPRPALPGNMMPPRGGGPPTTVNPVNPANPGAPAITTSPIVRVPSAAEMANGEQPRVMTEAEIEAAKIEAAKKALTNSPATAAASTNTNSGGRR